MLKTSLASRPKYTTAGRSSARRLSTSYPRYENSHEINGLKRLSSYVSQHPPRLLDQVAIVTGSSSGLGRAVALQYASHGTKLTVCADIQDQPRLDGVEEDKTPTHELIQRTYGQGASTFVPIDVSNNASVEKMVAEAVEQGGRLDM